MRGLLLAVAGVIIIGVGVVAGSTFGDDKTPVFVIIGVGIGLGTVGIAFRASSGGHIHCAAHGLKIGEQEILRGQMAGVRLHQHTARVRRSDGRTEDHMSWTILLSLAQGSGEIEIFETYRRKRAQAMLVKLTRVLGLPNQPSSSLALSCLAGRSLLVTELRARGPVNRE